MTNKVTTVVEYEVNKAIQNLSKMEGALEDAGISGKQLADELDKASAEAAANLTRMQAASDAMSKALGADFVRAKAEAGTSVDDIVMSLNKMGASFDAIAADADQLAASVRRLDDVRVQADGASRSITNLGSSSDQSRSVLANLAGNTAQDLGQIGGVAGTAGVAIGQLAEYAVDGNISLANLAKVAGPMALVTAAGMGLSMAFDAAAKRAEEAARKAGVLKEAIMALNEGETTAAAETLVEEYGKTLDILEEVGFTSADLSATLEGSGYVIRALEKDYDALIARLAELRDAEANDSATTAQLQELEATEAQLKQISAVLQTLRNDQGVWAETVDAIAENERRVADMNKILLTGTGIWAEFWQAAAQAGSVANDLADQDKAATSAANKVRALRDEVEGYIATTEGIPDEAVTEIRAALDSGNVALVERLLANLARSRTVDVKVRVAFGNPNERGKGAAVGSGSKATGPGYDPQGLLDDIMGDAVAAGAGGGGGGGGGGASSPAETEAEKWDDAIKKAYEYGEITTQQYIDYLTQRLTGEDRYSDTYYRLWKERQGLEQMLDDQAEKRRKDQEAAEKEAADAAEKARKDAEEATKALEKQQQALGNLIINVTNTSADPQSVVRAIEQARRMFGNRWLTG